MSQKLNSAIAVIGIDIGKNSFHIVGHDQRGAIGLRQKWSRGQLEARLANLPPCLVGMEACVGAHHLSRKLQMLGHDARLMPAKYVRPYSKGQKNDFRDAEAIAEAVQRPTMKFVATKTADQLDLQALHRVRDRLVGQRTGVINQIRAFLLERGIAVRQGLRSLRSELPGILATRTDVLSPRMLRIIEDLAGDWRRLDERVEGLSSEIETLARQDQACARLMTVPGIGPIISTAMVAAIGTGDVFSKGRDFGAWLGLVPKQLSTGDRTILGSISKRGNRYLRSLFVQAAWVVLVKIGPKHWDRYGLKSWIEAARKRLHHNVLAIALANKLARIAWPVLHKGRAFECVKTNETATMFAPRVGRAGTKTAASNYIAFMCGRFTRNYTWQQIHALYRLTAPAAIPNFQPRFNVCPTDPADVVVPNDGAPELKEMRWGLVPFWWNKPLKELQRLSTFN